MYTLLLINHLIYLFQQHATIGKNSNHNGKKNIIYIVIFSHDMQNYFAKDKPGVEGGQQHCVNSCCTIQPIT